MATTYMTSLFMTQVLLMAPLIMISSATTFMDLSVAIEEMQTANYFTFVTLINMSPLDHLIRGGNNNLTFLMPNDRMLAKINMTDNSVSDFLLRHSIPSPMLFDHLQHIPTGSIIPSSKPDFMLKISNNGRWSYYLNNVKLISPNICTAGSSIRCHGIDGVLLAPEGNISNPNLPTCSSTNTSTSTPASPVAANQHPTLSSPPFLSPDGSLNPPTTVAAAAPPPMDLNARPQKSGSSLLWFSYGGLAVVMASLILPLVVFSV